MPADAEQYRYDDLGRLISTTLDDGAVITYQYDAAGNRVRVASVPGDPANDPPVAVSDVTSTNEDMPRTISPLANDSDPQGQSLSLLGVGAASNGAAVRSGNQVVYTPNLNFFGTDSFGYEVSDGQLSSAATVTVNVVSVNDPPVAVPDATATTEDVSTVFDPRINDSDVESLPDALRLVGKTNGSKGVVSIVSSGTRLRYTPNDHANGEDTFTYTIRDADGATSTTSVAMSIAAVNDPVTAVNDSHATLEDIPTAFDPRINDSDPDGPAFTITSRTQGLKGLVTIINNGTRLHYHPYSNANGADSFSYTVSDGLSSDTAIVSMLIEPVNDPPTALDDVYDDVTRDGWVSLNVLAGDSDPDGDQITIVSVTDPLAGEAQVSANGQSVEYRYTAPFLLNADGFRYTIRDTGQLMASANVSVNFAGGGGFPDF